MLFPESLGFFIIQTFFKQRRPAGGAVGLRFVLDKHDKRDKHASGFGANTLEEVTITGNSLGTSDLIASS